MYRLPYTIGAVLLLALIIMGAFLPTHSSEPRIVVNMPAGAAPLSTLTKPGDKVVGPERATLWWSVYQETFRSESSHYAIQAANEAVDKVYGTTPPSHP